MGFQRAHPPRCPIAPFRGAPKGRESKSVFIKRFATDKAIVKKALAQMKPRIHAVYAAGGGHISMD